MLIHTLPATSFSTVQILLSTKAICPTPFILPYRYYRNYQLTTKIQLFEKSMKAIHTIYSPRQIISIVTHSISAILLTIGTLLTFSIIPIYPNV